MKIQPMKQKNIFANHISVMGLIPKIFSEHTQLNSQKNPQLKMGKTSKLTFLYKQIQTAET